MSEINEILNSSLKSLGMSNPTIHRLAASDCFTLKDLITHEEKITANLKITTKEMVSEDDTIYRLGFSTRTSNSLSNKGVIKVSILISISMMKLLSLHGHSYASIIEVINKLLELGFNEENAPLLGKESMDELIDRRKHHEFHRYLSKQNLTGKISKRTKDWYNQIMEQCGKDKRID